MSPAGRRCVLALGSNLGNRLGNLQHALRRLAPDVRIDRVSALYESDPVGPPGQPPYFNATCTGLTSLEPEALLRALKAIEWALGRRPGLHWGPRPVDIDILLIDGVILDTSQLTIPHPRIEERGFVLTPLADLLPDSILPSGRTVAEAAQALGAEGLRQIAGAEWAMIGPHPRPLLLTGATGSASFVVPQ